MPGQAKPWALDAGRLALEDYVRRTGADAEVLPGGFAGVYRLKRKIRGAPLVSIVIPTAARYRTVRGAQVDMLAAAIRSVVEKTEYREYELIVVADAAGVLPETQRALEGTRHQVLRFERLGLFNFSAKINAGVAASSGAHVLLFNDDLEVSSPEWLTAMLEYLARARDRRGRREAPLSRRPAAARRHGARRRGSGGARVPPASRRIARLLGQRRYGAQLLGCHRGLPDVAARGLRPGRGVRRTVPHRLQRRRLLPAPRRAGYRVVFTPFAQLYHHESASFGARHHDLGAVAEMRKRWGALIDRDPYYNPNLTRDFPDYRLDA